MDKQLLHRIRRPVGRNLTFDNAIIHIAKRGPLWLLGILAVLFLIGGRTAKLAVIAAIVSAVLTRGVNEIIGRFLFRPRPFIEEGFQPLLMHAPTSSFPSNHAACGFALAVAVWQFVPSVGHLMIVLAAILAFSRVYVGVHYPADVIFGSLIGAAIARATVIILT
jgi:undecaprenyl-diphosphatase